jgi:hypothetical protein
VSLDPRDSIVADTFDITSQGIAWLCCLISLGNAILFLSGSISWDSVFWLGIALCTLGIGAKLHEWYYRYVEPLPESPQTYNPDRQSRNRALYTYQEDGN